MPNDSTEAAKIRLQLEGDVDGSIALTTPAIGTLITREGDVVVRFRLDDRKDTFTEVGRKKIGIAPPPHHQK